MQKLIFGLEKVVIIEPVPKIFQKKSYFEFLCQKIFGTCERHTVSFPISGHVCLIRVHVFMKCNTSIMNITLPIGQLEGCSLVFHCLKF